MYRFWLLVTMFSLFGTRAVAQLRLARIFGDHMVLQRQQPLPVWGWADPDELVTVTLAQQTLRARADAKGAWKVIFAPLEAGGPYTVRVERRKEHLTLNDVWIGEVWLCSGQSNMEWLVSQSANAPKHIRKANYPMIRHVKIAHELAYTPLDDLAQPTTWEVASPATVGNFTAVGYFFAQQLYEALGVPIGLVNSSWGGSQAEGWISKETLAQSPVLGGVAATLPPTWDAAQSQLETFVRRRAFGPDKKEELEANYLTEGYDFSNWQTATMPGSLQWEGFIGFRGTAFLTKTVNIGADMAQQPTQLSLGNNDGPCTVYLNGKQIWQGPLSAAKPLSLAANTWHAGENRLIVKCGMPILEAWAGIGLHGQKRDLYVASSEEKIYLNGYGWKIRPSFASPFYFEPWMNNVATSLYNAMIRPLVPFAIQGVLWYQGESNAVRAYEYRHTFPLLIEDWRRQWAHTLPFYFVQLASFGANQSSNEGSLWAELREAQTMALSLPRTGMAVTIDVGDPEDIHPTRKYEVGQRLAALALNDVYQRPSIARGPVLEHTVFGMGEVTLTFAQVGEGLTVRDQYGYVRGFEVAGEDRKFYYAQGTIVGDRQIVLHHPQVPAPVAVRYAWADAPVDANVYNSNGLPAIPFRTDDWPCLTQKKRFQD